SSEGRDKLHRQYSTAIPCKHLVLDNFLIPELADELYANFPPMDTLNVRRKSINEEKAEDYHFDRFHPSFARLQKMVSSPEFYKWMEDISGVGGLKTTFDSLGSGVHQGANGSYVDVHVDLNMNPQ